MNSQEYIKMQVELRERGEVKRFEFNEKIDGFIYAEIGNTWSEYKAMQKNLVAQGCITKTKANDRLHGFRDYIRLNR